MSRTYRLRHEYHPPGVKHYTNASMYERHRLFDEILMAHVIHHTWDIPCILIQPLFIRPDPIKHEDWLYGGTIRESHNSCLINYTPRWLSMWELRYERFELLNIGTCNIYYHTYARPRYSSHRASVSNKSIANRKQRRAARERIRDWDRDMDAVDETTFMTQVEAKFWYR